MSDFDNFLDNLNILTERSRISDRRILTVQAMTFGKARIVVGKPLPHTDRYYDLEAGWCYLSHKAALDALEAWDPEKSQKPNGWIRDVNTGQYRIDGRADLEYIKNDYGRIVEEMLAYAISVTRDEPHTIKEFKLARAGNVFPFGTQRFVVISESPECPHDPKCQPISHVYQRFDRWVVLSNERFLNTTVDNVLRRLTSDNEEPWEVRHPGYLAELYGMSVVRLG